MGDLPQLLHALVGHLRTARHDDLVVRALHQVGPLLDQLGQRVGEPEQPAVYVLLQQAVKARVDHHVEAAQQRRDQGHRVEPELGAETAHSPVSSL